MNHPNFRPERIRTALFVDFDNMFISLKNQDESFARVFGENQEGWLDWIENSLGNPYGGYRPIELGKEKAAASPHEAAFSRKILVRRCYLNPKAFADFRPYFIKSGFEVIDCPQLTAQGKTSTDIHLVIDVLDTLYRSAQFDEFVILSGDADFTPLLLRLRMHDRRTVILSAGHASPAYKAACDHVIPTDTFIREALGIDSREDDAAEPIQPGEIDTQQEALLQKMAARVFEEADDPAGIEASDLPAIYSRFPEFKQSSHWLGFRSLRRLTEQIVSQRDDLTIVEEDPWCVARVEPVETLAPEAEGEADACEIDADLKESIGDCIRKAVDGSKGVIALAALANQINTSFARHLQGNEWFGAGDFKKFLRTLDLGDLKLSPAGPGYLYDPKRRDPSQWPFNVMGAGKKSRRDLFNEKHPGIAQLAWKIHQFTDVPYLMPEHYGLLFSEIAREVNERGYQLTRTSKTVRDRCVEKGAPVSRSNVNDILISLRNAGHRLTRGSVKPEKLAEIIYERVLNLCRIAQLELKPEEAGKVAQWITGGHVAA